MILRYLKPKNKTKQKRQSHSNTRGPSLRGTSWLHEKMTRLQEVSLREIDNKLEYDTQIEVCNKSWKNLGVKLLTTEKDGIGWQW